MIPSNKHPYQDREERAIDALIAGILRPSSKDETLDLKDIAPFVGAEEPILSAAAEAALAKLGSSPVAFILQRSRQPREDHGVHEEAMAGEFCGMYRKNPTGENAPEDEAELERQRQEALKKLRDAESGGQDPKDG